MEFCDKLAPVICNRLIEFVDVKELLAMIMFVLLRRDDWLGFLLCNMFLIVFGLCIFTGICFRPELVLELAGVEFEPGWSWLLVELDWFEGTFGDIEAWVNIELLLPELVP